jgi:uncharacterized protein (TIGR00251 family)
MLVNVRVVPRAKKALIKQGEGSLKIDVPAHPENGRANQAAIELLSKYFTISKSKIRILKGEKAREKIIELLN